MRKDEIKTWGEASLIAVGLLFILVGVVGILPGVPTYPGSIVAKFIVFLIACGFSVTGGAMVWLSAFLQDRRIRRSCDRRKPSPVLEGGDYRNPPVPRIDS